MTDQTGDHGRLVAVLKFLILLPLYVGVLFTGTVMREVRQLVTWAATAVGERFGHRKTPEPVTHDHRSR